MKIARRWIAGWFACVLAPVALAQGGDAVGRVDAYLATLNTLTADFSQVVRNRDGQIVDRASGKLSLSRPDRFRWDYQQPYLQTIVADGKQLWLYDSDLEQVTVRALEQGLGSTPAMLLSGSGKVGDAFTSGAVQRLGDWTWYRLVPKQQGSDFEQVSLAFDRKGELAAMELRDKLGQTTVIEFGALRRNVVLDQRLFRFEPPPGADVIGRAGS
ncbi:MAG TPA: outer membrane lipoprotein chaperone LolA [Quisquiliibacterium sp.]|nr:outer membrane lipoprotein chaperone LolA [Quisquiliibacterium sp.]